MAQSKLHLFSRGFFFSSSVKGSGLPLLERPGVNICARVCLEIKMLLRRAMSYLAKSSTDEIAPLDAISPRLSLRCMRDVMAHEFHNDPPRYLFRLLRKRWLSFNSVPSWRMIIYRLQDQFDQGRKESVNGRGEQSQRGEHKHSRRPVLAADRQPVTKSQDQRDEGNPDDPTAQVPT